MNTARKGRALEHAVRKLFEANGWSVMRGAASKGFFDSPEGRVKADLIATKCGRDNRYSVSIVALQCKAERM